MANITEIACFFRLALRVGLLDTAAVDEWIDSVIAAEPIVTFPFTELAGVSEYPRERVDELLGQVKGDAEFLVAGRMVLALLRRRLRAGVFTPETAIRLANEIARAGTLTKDEVYRTDALDDSLSLAMSDTYGDIATVRREIEDFLDEYEKFDQYIPSVV